MIPLELRAGIIAGHDALLMAGGLTVMILLQERLVRPRVVVSLEKVPGLHCIEVNGAARVGAVATHSEVVGSAPLSAFAPLLCRACGRVGSPAIRNMGTVGGGGGHRSILRRPGFGGLQKGHDAGVGKAPARENAVPISGHICSHTGSGVSWLG